MLKMNEEKQYNNPELGEKSCIQPNKTPKNKQYSNSSSQKSIKIRLMFIIIGM